MVVVLRPSVVNNILQSPSQTPLPCKFIPRSEGKKKELPNFHPSCLPARSVLVLLPLMPRHLSTVGVRRYRRVARIGRGGEFHGRCPLRSRRRRRRVMCALVATAMLARSSVSERSGGWRRERRRLTDRCLCPPCPPSTGSAGAGPCSGTSRTSDGSRG